MQKHELGKQVRDFKEIGTPDEGGANIYYGLIRNGKTYGATADIWDDVRRGQLVYATWPINLEAFDDRNSFIMILKNILLFRKRFYKINCPKNFHFIDAETGEVDGIPTFQPTPKGYIEYLNKLNHCVLYIDEAWRVIDSYKGTDIGDAGRNLILVTGHKYRTVNLITQRPTAVHVTARGNCSRFYKFVKIGRWPVPRFARYEFQVMVGETVDENQEPISVKKYWLNKKIANSYNAHFYGELKPLHEKETYAYDLTWKEKIKALFRIFGGKHEQMEHAEKSPFQTKLDQSLARVQPSYNTCTPKLQSGVSILHDKKPMSWISRVKIGK